MLEYAVIVTGKTRLEQLIARHNTESQAEFYVESIGGSFQDYVAEHNAIKIAVERIVPQLRQVLKVKFVDREFLPTYMFGEREVVVTIGQDGLVANTAKYVGNVPIISVNPDPKRYNGNLLYYTVDNVLDGVFNVLSQQPNVETFVLAEARLQDGQTLYAFNDLFVGVNSHVSARYSISHSGAIEQHSSSGVIVSTRAGMTGWMSSVLKMASGISCFTSSPTRCEQQISSQELLFAVREPYCSHNTQGELVMGKIDDKNVLTITSQMAQNGVVFSDGIESDFLKFDAGTTVTIGVAEKAARIVVPLETNIGV